jgi:ATP-binding cassette subfamily B protein
METSKVFEDFNLTIEPNQKLGIIGPSGAGKSTLINLLLRFFDVDSGEILIDGYNIKNDITQKSLRENISYIPQDPVLFHRTIRENIIYGKLDATEEELIEATKMACCYDFIMNLENGFDTIVGERGVKLSGGQRQRIAIARAILKNSKILILDEATSALDSITEKEIQKALENLMKNKTVIAIAHRLSTLNIMDRIVVLDKGKIVEDGTKEQLLNKQDGLFKKMWDMQKDGMVGEGVE